MVILERVKIQEILNKEHRDTNGSYRIYEATKTPLDTIVPFLEELVNSRIESPYILSMYIDIYEKRAKDSKAQVDQAALDMCDILASKLDTIREKYWAYKKQKLMAIHA